uniref:ASH domain-containing protein n=2 Tax=Macrostomum lignano TaxID=282301 RepID=A0A1I8GMF7_9PLAT
SAGSAPFLCLNRLALPDQVPVGSCHTAELSLTSCCDWRVELSISLAYCAEQVGNRFVTLATDQIPFALTPRLSLDARCSKPVLVKFAPRRSGFYLAEVLVQVASGASALPGCSRTVSLEAGGIGLRLVTPTGGQVTFDPPQSDLPVKQQQQMSQSRLVQLQNLSPEPATVLALLTCDSQAADDDVEFAFESAESAADVAEVQGDGRAIRLTVPGHSLAPLRLVCRRRRLGDSAAAAAAFDSRGRPP